MFELLFSLTGFIFGIILSLIAPEELKPGKKYFLLIKRILFLLLFFTINFFFYQHNQYFYLIPFTIIALVLFTIELKLASESEKLPKEGLENLKDSQKGLENSKNSQSDKSVYYEIPNYLIFIIPYFLISNQTFHILLPSLIFLYGLPAGTLIRKHLFTYK